MKKIFSFFSITVLFLTSLFVVPSFAFADTYGSGSYGGGLYGANSSSNSISSAISSVGSAISAFFCTNQPPASAPNLYQIDVKGTIAKLYFAPAAGPYDKHFVAFGQGNNSEGYGAEFSTSNARGALTYTVDHLSTSAFYTFKVRGGNGCKPGPWSNTMTIKTQAKGSKVTSKFYPKQQAKYIEAKKPSWFTQVKTYVSDLIHH